MSCSLDWATWPRRSAPASFSKQEGELVLILHTHPPDDGWHRASTACAKENVRLLVTPFFILFSALSKGQTNTPCCCDHVGHVTCHQKPFVSLDVTGRQHLTIGNHHDSPWYEHSSNQPYFIGDIAWSLRSRDMNPCSFSHHILNHAKRPTGLIQQLVYARCPYRPELPGGGTRTPYFNYLQVICIFQKRKEKKRREKKGKEKKREERKRKEKKRTEEEKKK